MSYYSRQQQSRQHSWAALGGIVLAIFFAGLRPPFLTQLQNQWLDRLDRSYPAPIDPRIVIVEVDTAALQREGLWPWPRATTAKLAQAIADGGPASTFFDFTFQIDREGDEQLATAFARFGDRNMLGVPVRFGAADQEAIVVPAGHIGKGSQEWPPIIDTRLPARLLQQTPNLLALMRLEAGYGDMFIRRLPCAARTSERHWFCPPLEVAAALDSNRDQRRLELAEALADDGNLDLRFAGAWSDMQWPHFSAADVLAAASVSDTTALSSAFKDKAVIVGLSADGYGDIVQTARESEVPGMWLHVVATNQFLTQTFAHRPHVLFLWMLLALPGILVWLVKRAHSSRAWLKAVGLVALSTSVGSWLAFGRWGWLVELVQAMLGFTLQAVAVAAVAAVRQLQEKARIATALGRYGSPALVQAIQENPALMQPKMDKATLTVMFSDIAGFTALSNTYQPEQVMTILSEYLDVMTKIVFKWGGTIDKIMGDGLLVLFGAPLYFRDHAIKAVAAGIEMQQEMKTLTAKWEAAGFGTLRVRIGINSTDAFVGNIGTLDHIEYTVMGRGVNLGQRLESKAPIGGLLISESTYFFVEDRRGWQETWIEAKGFGEKIRAFALSAEKVP